MITLPTTTPTNEGARPGDRLAGMDFAAHNAEVKKVWAAYDTGEPLRTPILVGTTTRYYLPIPGANPRGVTFREYQEDADLMFDCQLDFKRWVAFNVLQDAELGIPETWKIELDYQNYWEAAWFGCPVEYIGGEVPDTRPAFADCPERVMEHGLPDPFGGIMTRGLAHYERFKERAANETFLGRPIEVIPPWYGTGTNGPLTVACLLFGGDWVCTAMVDEPERLHTLLDFITKATIYRMSVWRKLCDIPFPDPAFGCMDDMIPMISVRQFEQHILPYLRRLYEYFASPAPRMVHLCGDATRHFPTLQRELNVQTFDTGFPVDFGKVRKELGPKARIQGGPHIELLRSGTLEQVTEETIRILQSGILEGGMFVLRDGNNVAPGTPLENLEAMYHAGRKYGYRREQQ